MSEVFQIRVDHIEKLYYSYNQLQGVLLPFQEDACKNSVTEFRDKIFNDLSEKLDTVTDEVKKKSLSTEIYKLKQFKASSGWFYNFMAWHKFGSSTPRLDAVAIDQCNVSSQQELFSLFLCTYPIEYICNTDEVVVLFCMFPSQSVTPQDRRYSSTPSWWEPSIRWYHHILDKHRFTTIPAIYAYGTKAPLFIIGKSKRQKESQALQPRKRPRWLYYSRKNAWNNQPIREDYISKLHEIYVRKGRKIVRLVDNFSAQSIYQSPWQYYQ